MTQVWWNILAPLRETNSPQQVFSDFVKITACVLNADREEDYLQAVRSYEERGEQVELFPQAFGHLMFERLLDPWTDTLGQIYMQLHDGQDMLGRRYHDKTSADMLAAIEFSEELSRKQDPSQTLTLHDPRSMSGALLLSALHIARTREPEAKLYVVGADPLPDAVYMTVINLSLAGIPGEVHLNDPGQLGPADIWYSNPSMSSVMTGPLTGLAELRHLFTTQGAQE